MWDSVAEFYPWRLFYASSLHQGWLPLWNPYQFCGTPFLANSQSAVFYPLNLIFVLLPVKIAFGASVLLHLFLAGGFCYLYLRRGHLHLSRTAALLGAIVWQMSTWQVAWLALPTFLCVSAWLSLALLFVDHVTEKPSAGRTAILGSCLGLMLLAGHLQIALYCFLLTAAYALFRLFSLRGTPLMRPAFGMMLIAVLLMTGLAAVHLLPAVELSRLSHRTGGVLNWQSYQGYIRLATPAVNLITLALPGFFGNPTQGTYWGVGTNGGPSAYMENACYLGILALLLVIYGVVATWKSSRTTRFFAVGALVTLLMALGTPLDALLFFGIPGFGQSGSPGRVLVLWTFCGAILAGIGTERLLAYGLEKALGWAGGILGLLVIAALGYTLVWVGHNAPSGTLSANLAHESDLWRLPVGILLALAALLYFQHRNGGKLRGMGAGLVALAALDLFASGLGYNRTSPPDDVYPVAPAVTFLQQHAAHDRMMPLNRRWSLYDPPPAILPPNSATVYGVYDTQGYDSLLTGQYMRFATRLDGNSVSAAPPEDGNIVFTDGYQSQEAQEADARYLVSRTPLPHDPNLSLVFQNETSVIYENHRAQPRARLSAGQGEAKIVSETPTGIVVQTESATPGADLTVADQSYPGWKAWVNGKPAPIQPKPDIFRTVTLPPGSSQVTMRFQPMSFRLGLYFFCLALAGIVFAATRSSSYRHGNH